MTKGWKYYFFDLLLNAIANAIIYARSEIMEFRMIIKCVRHELGLSQEQLARELNISFSTINRWENGKSRPSPMAKELFYSFCASKNIDINSFMKGEV